MKTLNYNQLNILGNYIRERDKKEKKELKKKYYREYYQKHKNKLKKYQKEKYRKLTNRYNDIEIIEGKFIIEL